MVRASAQITLFHPLPFPYFSPLRQIPQDRFLWVRQYEELTLLAVISTSQWIESSLNSHMSLWAAARGPHYSTRSLETPGSVTASKSESESVLVLFFYMNTFIFFISLSLPPPPLPLALSLPYIVWTHWMNWKWYSKHPIHLNLPLFGKQLSQNPLESCTFSESDTHENSVMPSQMQHFSLFSKIASDIFKHGDYCPVTKHLYYN